MKKYIFGSILSLLMCGNFVFAQTNNPNLEIEVRETINQQLR